MDEFEKLTDILEWNIKQYRTNNDDIFLMNNLDQLRKSFEDLLRAALNLEKNDLILNNIFALYAEIFNELMMLSTFKLLELSAMTYYILSNFFDKNSEFRLLLQKFIELYKGSNEIAQINNSQMVLKTVLFFKMLKKDDIKLINKKFEEINNIKNQNTRVFNKMIALNLSLQFFTYKNLFHLVKAHNLLGDDTLDFLNNNLDLFETPFIRMIEMIFIKINWNKQKWPTEISHYTSMEVFNKIITSKSLKFTNTQKLNDSDENTLISEQNEFDVFNLSLTTKTDSVDFFNNYGDVSIVFDGLGLSQKLFGIDANTGHSAFTHQFEDGFVQYKNNVETIIESTYDIVSRLFGKLSTTTFFKKSWNAALHLLGPYYKKTPWEYEKEYRICVLISKNINYEYIQNMSDDRQEILVNLNIKAKNTIKKVILGPSIKNSDFHIENLKRILRDNDLKHVKIVKSEANFRRI